MQSEVVICCERVGWTYTNMDSDPRTENAEQEVQLDVLREPRCIHLWSVTQSPLTQLLALVILLGSTLARAELYSCVAPDGRSVLQGEPCRRGQHAPSATVAKSYAPSSSAESNLPAIAKRKCIEAGYFAQGAEVFNACQQDIRQTAYKHLCEQAGRVGERLDACLQNLYMHDERYAGLVRLDYYCIARDKKYDSPQYRACADQSK